VGLLAPSTYPVTTLDALRQSLRERGYIDGENLQLEARYFGSEAEDIAHLAADLVTLPVDVVATVGNAAIRAVQDRSKTLPIVNLAGDPCRAASRLAWQGPEGR